MHKGGLKPDSFHFSVQRTLNLLEQTVKLVDGHYVLPLPWEEHPPHLLNYRTLAEPRLRYLHRRLLKDVLAEKYAKSIDDYISKGFAEKAATDEILVFNPNKPKKTRVIVFDCAAKFEGKSLNDHLMQGPGQTSSLIGVLLRFRQDHVAVVADIEAMFLQVRVD